MSQVGIDWLTELESSQVGAQAMSLGLVLSHGLSSPRSRAHALRGSPGEAEMLTRNSRLISQHLMTRTSFWFH